MTVVVLCLRFNIICNTCLAIGKPMRGKFRAIWILKNVMSIFGNSFAYHRQLADATGTNVMLEFSCMVDEIPAQGQALYRA